MCHNLQAQKAKVDPENINIKKVYFAKYEVLPNVGYTYTYRDQYNAVENIEKVEVNSGSIYTGVRMSVYDALYNSCNDSIKHAKKKYTELVMKSDPFIHIDAEFRDIHLSEQILKTTVVKEGEKEVTKYFYELKIRLASSLIALYVIPNNQRILLDTINSNYYTYKFPQDFGAINNSQPTDINLMTGYTSAHALQIGFEKYSNTVKSMARDREIIKWFSNCYSLLNERYTNRVKKETIVYYTDKNKKGGYEDIVKASSYFELSMNYMTQAIEDKVYTNYWSDTIQKMLNISLKIWEKRLEEINFDLNTKDQLLTEQFIHSMFYNYVQALILTGQFDKAKEKLSIASNSNVKGFFFNQSLSHLHELIKQERTVYNKHKTNYNFVRLNDIKL